MADNANLSLRQLGTPDLTQQPLCITFPTLETNANFELKSGLINLLPAFHGLAASRAANIRKENYGIKQFTGESLHEYWERSMLDAASGGVFVDKTPVQARNLIEMAANSQQFGTNRNDHAPRKKNEVNVSSLEQQLIELTNFVRQMAVGNGQTVRACGVCAKVGHATDMCPTLQEGSAEQDLATNTVTFQSETRASFQQLNTQMGQLATAVNRLEALNSCSLPSQTMVNPKDNRKHKLKGCQKVELGEQVSAVIQIKVPTKFKDSGPLNKTEIVIQMADISTIYPRGLLEDVLVQVDNLVFPADFYVLDMKSNDLINSPIFLGIPFLKTSKSIIDVNNGTLTMEFDREVVKFHIFDTLQIPDCESVVNNLDFINHLSQEHKKVVNEDKVKEVIARPIENFIVECFCFDLQLPRKSKQRKQRPKITEKLRKWVKVVRKTRYEPP
ncbi:uncharacterized protein [Henckelia pumila]|uniref:uncharacterized protein n=1 Tax=Henckelia pumila TaxID=405737 RepID=UPI003C6E0E0D